MSFLTRPARSGSRPTEDAYMPTTPTSPRRTAPGPADQTASLMVVVAGADPAGEIVLGLDAPEGGGVRFETQPPYDCGVVVGRGHKPEFVAVDPSGLIVSVGAGEHYTGKPIGFSILLTVGADADVDRIRLSAVAAPGTELAAVLGHGSHRRFSGGQVELEL